MKFPYGEICGWSLDWSHLEEKPGEGVSIIIYVFVPMLTLNPSVLPSTLKSTLGQYLLSKLKKKKRHRASICSVSSFSNFLREWMPPKQDSPTVQADRRGKMNPACQLQFRSSVKCFIHGSYTTGHSGFADIPVSTWAFQACEWASEPCCCLSVNCPW